MDSMMSACSTPTGIRSPTVARSAPPAAPTGQLPRLRSVPRPQLASPGTASQRRGPAPQPPAQPPQQSSVAVPPPIPVMAAPAAAAPAAAARPTAVPQPVGGARAPAAGVSRGAGLGGGVVAEAGPDLRRTSSGSSWGVGQGASMGLPAWG